MNPFSHSTASGLPERGSDELSLGIWMRFSTKKNNKTWEAICSESQWHWSGFHQPCQTWSRTRRQGCRRDWKLLYFFQIFNFTYTVKAHCHRISKPCWCRLLHLGQLVWKGQHRFHLKKNRCSNVKQHTKTSLALLNMARMPRTWQVGWSDPAGPRGLQSKRLILLVSFNFMMQTTVIIC